jgi:hypothetical protein
VQLKLSHCERFAIWVLPISALFRLPSPAMADGGTIRLSEQAGNYQIAVFTSPTPLRAGPVDVSMLIQDAATRKPVSEVQVTITAKRRDRPNLLIRRPATIEAATNKLFRAATFELPEPGSWDIDVSIDGPLGKAQARFDVEASESLPRCLAMWWWIGWPVLPILLFSWHQVVVKRTPQRVTVRNDNFST